MHCQFSEGIIVQQFFQAQTHNTAISPGASAVQRGHATDSCFLAGICIPAGRPPCQGAYILPQVCHFGPLLTACRLTAVRSQSGHHTGKTTMV